MDNRRLARLTVICATLGVLLLFPITAHAESTGTQNMYRLYNPNSGEHFYTSSEIERDEVVSAGWSYEGIGWVAPQQSDSPVYRLYNPNAGEHHYTMQSVERDALVEEGWIYEGVGWYSDDEKRVPLWRQYNPNAFSCNHNYTVSGEENDTLVTLGWNYEGIAWYAVEGNGASTATVFETPLSTPRERDTYLATVTWTNDSAYIALIADRAVNIGSDTDYFVAIDNELCRVIVFERDANNGWVASKLWNCNGGKNGVMLTDWGLGAGIHKVVHKRQCNWDDSYFGKGYNDWSTDFIEWYQSDSLGHLRYVAEKGAYEACLAIHATSGTLTGWDNTGCCALLYDNAKWVYDNVPVGSTVYAFKYSRLI